jgi:hypothetical protein
MIRRFIFLVLLCLGAHLYAEVLYEDTFEGDGLMTNKGVGGGAVKRAFMSHSWEDSGDAVYEAKGDSDTGRALLVSKNSFQSDTGFRLTVGYVADSIKEKGTHEFSFGLICSESDPDKYKGDNPFRGDSSVYSIGVSLTEKGGDEGQGLNFSDGSTSQTLDQSGTRVQFETRDPCTVTIEVEPGGTWCYRINGVYEASGVLLEGFDLTKSYHVAVYGQGSEGGKKEIQFLKLERGYAPGERAEKSRGTWSGGMGLDKIQDFRTLDTVQVRLTDGAVLSASHWAPNKLLEKLWGGDMEKGKPVNLCVPLWGDLSKDEPENDPIREKMLAIKAAGFKVKAYANCENFNGSNSAEFEVIAQRWKKHCDTDREVVAFVESQPFHTGIWDRNKKMYVDASDKFPDRKYMFCYAELILKDYALRYGDLIDAWIFDSATDINQAGDQAGSGLIEEQRVYQAFANAVHAGNPHIAIAFNNGRSTVKSKSFPYATPTRFDDFTFGHAFGGNNSHGEKNGGTFDRNYLYVKKMTETDGYVFAGGEWDWDDKIVGNMHSKLATTGWKSGAKCAWEEKDFLQWNLEAMLAGGIMTWDGSASSKYNRDWTLREWAYDLLKALDDHLAVYQFPGAPNWARAYTVLPDAVLGDSYEHALIVGKDLWDPEGDPIKDVEAEGGPSWLKIRKGRGEPESWELSGKPSRSDDPGTIRFTLTATDSKRNSRSREVELRMVK